MNITGQNIDEVELRLGEKVFTEDDVNYIDKITTAGAYYKLTGEQLKTNEAIIEIDCGDFSYYLMPNGYVVMYSYDGGEIYAPPTK